ncbi:hypothetical protein K443DRAFT_4698 [Laccaria amethystina LaAM-08-1]|uniref:Uncharacterized protein n=1 Tax=Laccaria amethystina LaAM-08-1 TaxID=1095629 RepID=A0A0C9XRU0_9AGAR|nr:hypothetical protein K443DRAFT_4698 [Laccaria amethystina LaAM-08-1]
MNSQPVPAPAGTRGTNPFITCLTISITNFPISAFLGCVNLTDLSVFHIDFDSADVDEQESSTLISNLDLEVSVIRVPRLQVFAYRLMSGQYVMHLLNAKCPNGDPMLDFTNVRTLSVYMEEHLELAVAQVLLPFLRVYCLYESPGERRRFPVLQALSLAWLPRADGVFLADSPLKLVQQWKVSGIPFVTGNVNDEGTTFALLSLNITNDAEFREYIKTYFLPKAPDSELVPLWSAYPNDPRDGSTFDTGFPPVQAHCGFLRQLGLSSAAKVLPPRGLSKDSWNFYSEQTLQIPPNIVFQIRAYLGYGFSTLFSFLSVKKQFHGTDLRNNLMNDYLIQFTTTLNPNNGTDVVGPQYAPASLQLYTFPTLGLPNVTIDNYSQRAECLGQTWPQIYPI